ncbi:hypothetical protein U737_22900 [Methylomonas sp. LW13]|nr:MULTISPECIES: hypothetical protein [unclassified Methylomonas]PKD40113.1 hypothetical protein CWO84_10965 [Methylomonas sp. Kb3]QBC29529.1 hypothetical protein U737_22900 [Methylomonas sp. LW13]
MERYRLSFCNAIKLDEDLAEFIVDEGVELNLALVDEYHAWIVAHLQRPYLLLVHKVNAYHYDFASQTAMGTLLGIKAAAFVVYTHISQLTTQVMLSMPRDADWVYRIFNNRDDALMWLGMQRESNDHDGKTLKSTSKSLIR